MGNLETGNVWDKIQQGVRDSERLIGQKQFNMSMIKARQTLEFMVKCLAERALIVEGDLVDTIDQLYTSRMITKTTYEHYHKIRMIGNKAVHEGDNSASNASQAYHMLSQEVYTFANAYANKRRRPSSSRQGSQSSKGRKRSNHNSFNPNDLIKPLLILLAIILIFALVKFLTPKKEEKAPTTAPTTTALVTMAPETSLSPVSPIEPTTVAVSTAPVVYTVSGTNVNVRSAASTDSTVLGKLAKGSILEFVAESNGWITIKYNGKDAFISAQFVTKQ